MKKLIKTSPKKLTLISVAAYFFIFAVCAKGIHFYASQHPPKEELVSVQGIIQDVHLGGQGSATRLQIKTEHGTNRYSSYYGKVWPGMEQMQQGDQVDLLAERNRLNTNEFFSGKRYYIWELIHLHQTIINYEDVRDMVQGIEATVNWYFNLWLAVGFVFLLVAYLRKRILKLKG